MAMSAQEIEKDSEVRNNLVAQTSEIAGKGQFDNVPFGKLYRSGNVRTDATKRLPEMVESYKRFGFKPNHPVVLSAKSNGTYLVLCGNRRTESLEMIAKSDSALFGRILPDGTIPAIVHYNLTEAQEALLMIDHGRDEDRVPLDSAGEFFAIEKLVKAGYDTQSGIAERLSWYKTDNKTKARIPNRSKVQPYVQLSRLPVFIKTQFVALLANGLDATNVRWSMIGQPPQAVKSDERFKGGLSGAYNREFTDYPEGNGPILTELWAICNLPATEKPIAPKMLSADDIKGRAQSCGSKIVRDVLHAILGLPNAPTLADTDANAVRAESAQATLADISAHIGEDEFNNLIAEIGSNDCEDSTEDSEVAEVVA